LGSGRGGGGAAAAAAAASEEEEAPSLLPSCSLLFLCSLTSSLHATRFWYMDSVLVYSSAVGAARGRRSCSPESNSDEDGSIVLTLDLLASPFLLGVPERGSVFRAPHTHARAG
jgi:hypothetical protein